MITDEERFHRSSDYIKLSTGQIQELVGGYFDKSVEATSLLKGGFANTNYKFSLKGEEKEYVLRLPQKNKDQFKREIAVLRLVSDRVAVPKVIADNYSEDFPFAILEFARGVNFNSMIAQSNIGECNKAAYNIGQQLSQIHSFTFAEAGFFDENFEFTVRFENFGNAYLEHLVSSLNRDYVKRRMGANLHQRVVNVIKDYRPIICGLPKGYCLLHGDFNNKNMLIDHSRVTAILDWEFASSGYFLADIGNFLRFETDFPASIKESFIEGYQANGSKLPEKWEEITKILDWTAMADFLSSNPEEELPKSTKTAISIFQSTVKFLDY